MRRILIAGMAISLASGLACAATGPIPQEVAAHIEDMNQICREAGGTPAAPKIGLLVSGDLDGGGAVDWAIDEGRFNCDGAVSIFSGSGGSQVYVFVGTHVVRFVYGDDPTHGKAVEQLHAAADRSW